MAANNKANVSTTRGNKGGYLFSAPVGTAGAPTKTNFKAAQWLTNGNPPEGWECLGYIPTDGFTETPDLGSGEAIRDINQEQLDETEGEPTETIIFALMEIKKHTLGTVYGHDNVTDDGGVLEAKHKWGNRDEHYQYVFLLLLKNDRAWTKYIPDGKVSSVAEFTGNKTTVAKHEVTVTYLNDEDGTGCYDWFDSTETPAPQLTALSGTGITLSPTFAAGTRTYTATSSAGSTTITATAGTGKTVAVKDGNGNSYSSGGSVPLVTGKNVLTITVTDTSTGAKGIYTLTITKS